MIQWTKVMLILTPRVTWEWWLKWCKSDVLHSRTMTYILSRAPNCHLLILPVIRLSIALKFWKEYKSWHIHFMTRLAYALIYLHFMTRPTYALIYLHFMTRPTYALINLYFMTRPTYALIYLHFMTRPTYALINLHFMTKTYLCIDLSTIYVETYVCIDQSTFYRLSICWVGLFTIIQDHVYSKACVYIPFQLILNECNQEVYDWVSGQYYHVISHVLQTQSYKFDCWSRVCFIIPIYGSAILTWMHIHVAHNWWKQEHNISKTYSDK